MLFSINSRTLKNVIKRNINPSTSKAAKDCCHVNPIPWHNVKAKKALSPMLGACAKGYFAIKASKIVAMADAIAVAVNTPALSMPVVLRIIGFTANI